MKKGIRILYILMIILYGAMLFLCFPMMDYDSYGAMDSYAYVLLADQFAIILYLFGIMAAVFGLLLYEKERAFCRVLGWILFLGIVLDLAFLFENILILLPVLLLFSVLYLCSLYPKEEKGEEPAKKKPVIPIVISIILLAGLPPLLLYILYYHTNYKAAIYYEERLDALALASILIFKGLMILAMLILTVWRSGARKTQTKPKPSPFRTWRTVCTATLCAGIFCMLFIPVLCKGKTESGQHMNTVTYEDENGEMVTVDEPGIIEYYITYSPFEEFCLDILYPVSKVLIIASASGMILFSVLLHKDKGTKFTA